MQDFTVGLVGLSFPNFSAAEYGIYPQAVEAVQGLATDRGFHLVAADDTVASVEQAHTARRRLEEAGVDFLLVQASSFAVSDAFVTLAEMDVPLGIWGVPEPTLDGEIPLNSFTGLNLFASVLRVNLAERRWPFKWFYGDPGSARFRRRLELTIRALAALKALEQARIGLVGDLAPGFPNLAYDAAGIRANLGPHVERVRLEDAFERVRQCDPGEASSLAGDMMGSAVGVAVERAWMERTARVVLALEDVADEGGYDALALRCWPEFQDELGGLGPCAAVAWLNEVGLPTACEGDLVGAVSMLTLHLLTERVTTMMDLVTVLEDQDLIHLWHCGPTAPSLADVTGQRLTYHPTLDRASPPEAPRSGVASDVVLAPGPATVARFGGAADRVFLLSAQVVEGPSRGYDGSRGWVTDLRMDGESLSGLDFVETMAHYGLPHHYPLVLEGCEDVMRELAAWRGIQCLNRIPHRDHLTP